MANLIDTSAAGELLPLTHGALTLAAPEPQRLSSVAPFRGQEAAVGAALGPLGLGFPAPNRALASDAGRIVWTGHDQAFLIGADPAPLDGLAALTDQSDGWTLLRLEGAGWEAALARLVPLDLRPASFGEGQAARSFLGHMSAVFVRVPEGVEILIFRSMTRTAVHEIGAAMKAVAARAALI